MSAGAVAALPRAARSVAPRAARKFWGKYRGQVVDNIDPLELNRLLVLVPTLPGLAASFALPCQPYGGFQVGMVLTPPVGANVWIEFENGDPAYPVWTGCFWTEGQKPVLAELPTQQVFSTGSFNLVINDVPEAGELLVSLGPPGFDLPITLSANSELCTLTVGETVLSVSAEEASLLMEPTTLVVTNEEVTVAAAGEINVTVPELSVEGDTNVIGAVEVEGNTEITGAVEIEGNTNITGAVEVEGEINVAGAVQVEGDANVAGAVEVEGDIAAVGAVEVAGDVAVAGAVEVVGDVSVVGVVDVVGDVALVGAMEVAGAALACAYVETVGNFV